MRCIRMADACASDAAVADDRDDAQQYYAADGRRLCDGSLADCPFTGRAQRSAGILSGNLHLEFEPNNQNVDLLPQFDTVIVFVFRGGASGFGGMFHVDIFSITCTIKNSTCDIRQTIS